MSSVPHLLHVFSTFVPAGPETRAVQLIAALGAEFRHSIVALDGRHEAAALLPPEADARVLEAPPRAGSWRTTRRLMALARRERPDLVLSYNWGAFDAVLASRLRRRAHIHHEDGFNADEARGFVGRRVLARRLVLPGVQRVIVPSLVLEKIARELWRLPPERVLRIPNGVRLERFPPRDGAPALRARLGIPGAAVVLGWVGHLRPEKNVLRFLEAAARVDPALERHVLIVGDGPERAAAEQLAARRPTLAGRAHFVGHQREPAEHYRAMDVFCLSSDTEQMPIALVEAMASALPVAATDVGDVRWILGDEQAAWVVPRPERETAWPLAEALDALCKDAALRRRLGAASRARVAAELSFERMVEAHGAAWRAALASGR